MQLNLETNSYGPCLTYELMETPPASALAGRPIYVAKIVHRKPINLLTLARKLTKRTPYRVDDVVHILSSLASIMQEELANGHTINFGSLFHMTPTIHGTFDALDEAWDPTKHHVVVKACTGKLLRDASSAMPTRNVTPRPSPTPPSRTAPAASPTPTLATPHAAAQPSETPRPRAKNLLRLPPASATPVGFEAQEGAAKTVSREDETCEKVSLEPVTAEITHCAKMATKKSARKSIVRSPLSEDAAMQAETPHAERCKKMQKEFQIAPASEACNLARALISLGDHANAQEARAGACTFT